MQTAWQLSQCFDWCDLREWAYYARSEGKFIERLNHAHGASALVFPIQIHVAEDPGWSMYVEFRAGLVDETLRVDKAFKQ